MKQFHEKLGEMLDKTENSWDIEQKEDAKDG